MKKESPSTSERMQATPEQLAAQAHRVYVLEQLGIQPLVSLQDAPGAAAAQRVVLPNALKQPQLAEEKSRSTSEPAEGTERFASQGSSDASSLAALRASLSSNSGGKSQRVPAATSTSDARHRATAVGGAEVEPAISFQLLIAATGRWLWVERLIGGLIRKDQLQLIHAMGRVLDGQQISIRHVQFDWPLVDHPQLPRDMNAARQSVAGQLQRLAREASASGIVILGENTGELISEAINLTRIGIPATIDMLQDPMLKRDAWQIIRPHVIS